MPRKTRDIENWFWRQTVRSLLSMLRVLPERALLPFGSALGVLGYHTLERPRSIARGCLQRAYGETCAPDEIERMVRGNFVHLGQALVEFLKMSHWGGEEIERRVELRGLQHLDSALAAGRGAICVTAHYGNWEMLGARAVQAGYPLHVIARRTNDPALHALVQQIRARHGYQVIPRTRRNVLRPSLECLRRNEVLGVLLDRNTQGGGETFVEFFGRTTAVATGPAVLARRTGAAILPAFDRRQADGRHIVEVLPAMEWERTDDPERDVWEMTVRLTQAIEAQIRIDPTQWYWIYDRWKRQPPATATQFRPLIAEGTPIAPGDIGSVTESFSTEPTPHS